MRERYADERRTEIAARRGRPLRRGPDRRRADGDLDDPLRLRQAAAGHDLPQAEARRRGVTGMDLKEGDYIEHLLICSTHDYLLFFTNRGKVYRLKVYELPEGSRTAKGSALVNVLPLRDDERVMAVIPTRDFKEAKYLAFATANGPGQEDRVPRLQHADPRRRDHRDQGPRRRRAGRGPAHHRRRRPAPGLEVRPRVALQRGRGALDGPRHLRRQGHERLRQGRPRSRTGCWRWTSPATTPSCSWSPRTATASAPPVSEYPVKGRGTKGVLTIKLTERKGGLAGALIVREHQDLLFISQNGMVQRTKAGGISQMGRATQGVRVMNIKDDDRVSAVALVVESLGRRCRGGRGGRRGGCRRRAAGLGLSAARASATSTQNRLPSATLPDPGRGLHDQGGDDAPHALDAGPRSRSSSRRSRSPARSRPRPSPARRDHQRTERRARSRRSPRSRRRRRSSARRPTSRWRAPTPSASTRTWAPTAR